MNDINLSNTIYYLCIFKFTQMSGHVLQQQSNMRP